MAEIEFKRRGTPLWAVVLVLLVVAAGIYAFMHRGAPATVDSVATAPAVAVDPNAQAKSPPLTAPGEINEATAAGPVVKFGAWVDSASTTTDAAAQRAQVARGLRLLADALQERLPLTGAQVVLTRAMADTVELADRTPVQATNAAQAGFFAVAYAMRTTPGGASLEQKASALQLTKPLTEQRDVVKGFFGAARDVMRDPSKGGPATPASKAAAKS